MLSFKVKGNKRKLLEIIIAFLKKLFDLVDWQIIGRIIEHHNEIFGIAIFVHDHLESEIHQI